MEELEAIIQRMIDAGEPEENIKTVIEGYEVEDVGFDPTRYVPGVAGDILTGPLYAYEKILQAGQGLTNIADNLIKNIETGQEPEWLTRKLAQMSVIGASPKAVEAVVKDRKKVFDIYTNHVVDMVQQGASRKLIQETDPTNVVKLEPLINWFERTLPAPKIDKETGEAVDYLKLYGDGKIIEGTDAFMSDVAGAVPSILISRIPVLGPTLLGASTYMGEFEDELIKRAKDPKFNLEEDLDNLIQNALITGGADVVLETVGGSLLNKIPGMQLGKETVKEILTEAPKQLLKKSGLGFLSEFATEGATGVVTDLADVVSFGDDVKPVKDYLRTFVKDGFVGGFLGGTVTSVGGIQNRNKIYEYVSPQTYKQEQLGLSSSILTLEQDKQKASSKDKKYFDTKIQELKNKKESNQKNLYTFFDNSTEKEKVEYASNIDKQNEALDVIGNKNLSELAQQEAEQDLRKYTEANNKFFDVTDVDYDAGLEQEIGLKIKAAQRIAEKRGAFGFNNKNLNVVELNTAEEVKEVASKIPGADTADGIFLGENKDGKSTIYINNPVAIAKGSTNVLGHEYLHAIISKAFKTTGIGNENLSVAAKSFVDYLNSIGEQRIVERVEKRLADNYGGLDTDGNIVRDENGLVKTDKKQDQEEYFNLFSDLISKEKIKRVEEKSGGIKNAFRQLMTGLGFSKVDFKNGKQVFDFLVDYNANMEKSGITGRLLSKRIAKTKMTGLEATAAEKAAMDQIKKESRTGYEKTARDQRIDAIGEQSTKTEWDAGGADMAISDMYMSGDLEAIVRNNLSSDLKNLPNYSEEDFISETIGELMPHIKNFNIDKKETQKGFGLSGWIRGQISNKIGNVLKKKKATTETFTVDTTDEKVKETVEATDALEDLQEEDISISAQAKKKAKAERREEKGMEADVEYSTFRRALKVKGKQGLSDNIVNDVKKAVVKTMSTERTTPDSDKFIANIKKSFLTELKKPIQDMMGKKDDFTNFLKTNREAIIAALPTSTLVQMERNVDPADRAFTVEVKKNLSPTETDEAIANNQLPKDTNRNSGPTLYSKRMPSEGEFLKYFNPPLYVPSKKDPSKSVRSGLKGTRKDTLAEQMGIELAFDATMEVVQSPEVAERRSLVTDNEFTNTEVAELAKAIDRGVDIKFSKSKLRAEELTAGMAREVDKLISKYSNDNESIIVVRDDKGKAVGYESRDTIEKGFVKGNYSKKDSNLIAELAYKLYNSNKYSRLYDVKTRNKIYNQIIKAQKEGKTGISLQANRIHEQLFITSLGNLMKSLNKDIVVNRFIEEGGKGDVYATLGDETVGVEIKMDEADGTSQTVYVGLDKDGEFTFEYINPNKSARGKISEDALAEAMKQTLKDTNKILKAQGLEITSDNIEKYGDNKSRIVLNEAQAGYLKQTGLKTMALSGSNVDSSYITSAYGDKTLPEGFIHVGSKLYRMVTGNQKVDQQSRRIASFIDKKIPVFANKDNADFSIVMEMSEFKKRKDGRFNVVFRSAPKIKGKYLVDSNVNLLKKEDMQEFAKAVELTLVEATTPTEAFNVSEYIETKEGAKFSKSKDKPNIKDIIASSKINEMIERSKGVSAKDIISGAEARRTGKNKNPFQFFVPPSADDLSGLLYYLAGKGKQGEADLKFMKQFLLDPLGKGERSLATKKQQIITDYKELKKELTDTHKKLKTLIPDSKYTYDTAVRVFLWNQEGYDIPDISDKEVGQLVAIVNNDTDLQEYAQKLASIGSNYEGKYPEPTEDWIIGSTAKDLYDVTSKVGRKKFLAEFIENSNAFFNKDAINKLTLAYGTEYTDALKDILHRIKTGENRPSGTDATTNKFMNWVANSTGAIMFFNTRSAVLQTLSTVNYLNWSDNNPLLAGKAFANQKQFWTDFAMIFNSDMLKQRRSGLSTDIQAAEIASAAAGAKNKANAAIAYILKKGFLPTQMADSFAISAGGAAFYRNRVNSYVKQGMDQKAAEEKAFADFADITEENQQSARPDRISQQQASPLGRLILAFQNTPMQYNRIIKKAMLDLHAGRGDTKTNVSKIIYYAGAQAFVFASLQNALFAMLFDDEDENKSREEILKEAEKEQLKLTRVINSMIDGILNGSGVKGRVMTTIKNTILKFIEEDSKEWNANYTELAVEAAQLSPPIGSKLRKLQKAGENYGWNKKAIKEIGYDNYFNPIYVTAATFTEAATNIPLARAVRKLDNLVEAADQNNAAWQRVGLLMGWSQWDMGIEGKRRQVATEAKEEIKKKKKEKKKEERKAKEKRCSAIKSNGKRCKNITTNESGRCYAHD